MIINPGELKFGIKAGPYPVITTEDDFEEYSKTQKGRYIVELGGSLLPLVDLLGARIIEVDLEEKTFRTRLSKTHLKKVKDFKEIHVADMYFIEVRTAPPDGGSVNPLGGEFDKDSEVTFTAIPDNEYEFDKWTGGWFGTDNPITITVNSDMKTMAHFKKKK